MWTSDPSNSLIVANPAHGQAQKITPANDGGFFISWLDQEQGYSLYLQRLDALGNLLLPLSSPTSAGILVYQRVVPYSTDYGVTIDNAGNVIFGIDSGIQHADGSSDVGGNAVACKVSPEGELLFGSTGIIVSSEGENIGGDVHCTATNDGGVVFGWGMGEYFSTQFTKISHTGAIAWSTSLTRPSPELQISLNSIASSDNGLHWLDMALPVSLSKFLAARFYSLISEIFGLPDEHIAAQNILRINAKAHAIRTYADWSPLT